MRNPKSDRMYAVKTTIQLGRVWIERNPSQSPEVNRRPNNMQAFHALAAFDGQKLYGTGPTRKAALEDLRRNAKDRCIVIVDRLEGSAMEGSTTQYA